MLALRHDALANSPLNLSRPGIGPGLKPLWQS
jgi:hypothetical protein